MPPKSPLAPPSFPKLPAVAGVKLAAAAAGIRYSKRPDLLFVELAKGTTAAGVYTRSLTASAPVDWCRSLAKHGKARGLVVNSGNANAFTGKAGVDAVTRSAAAAAKLLGCPAKEIYLASTGVIGETLSAEKIEAALPGAAKSLKSAAWADAAAAIMTTDTFPKGSTRTVEIAGKTVTINGIAKGSGMIAPDMATMLGFVFTDAKIPAKVLKSLLSAANKRSFNAITVDSDTSTSDSCVLFATGQAKHKRVAAASDAHLREFKRGLLEVLTDLAQQIVRDGEGATKFVSVTVTGADGRNAAHRIAMAIANSPLVKTAVAGEDANWGRIVMAVGKSGEKADRDALAIRIGGIEVTRDGMVAPDYDETPVAQHMKGQEIDIAVDVGIGRGSATVWTCDLTHGYIDINGSYRS